MTDVRVQPERGRPLGPEMIADRWYIIGDDDILWSHEPSHRCVVLRERLWGECKELVAVGEQPTSPDAEGYVVSCQVHDDNGNPTGDGGAVWISSYGRALRFARAIRKAILGSEPLPRPEQIPMFDTLDNAGDGVNAGLAS